MTAAFIAYTNTWYKIIILNSINIYWYWRPKYTIQCIVVISTQMPFVYYMESKLRNQILYVFEYRWAAENVYIATYTKSINT